MDDPNNPANPVPNPVSNPVPAPQPAPVIPEPAVQIPVEPPIQIPSESVPVTTPAPQPEILQAPVVPASQPVQASSEQVASAVSAATVESSMPFSPGQSDQSPLFGGLRGILNNASWILMITLAPITILVIFAQYAVPGDIFYPVKRVVENVVLAGASVHPTTRAFFHADLASRRFDEAEKLLIGHADVKGLSEFVEQIQETQAQIQTVTDPVQKKELEGKLQTSISDYETRLIAVKTQIEATTPTIDQGATNQDPQTITEEPTPQTEPTQVDGQTAQPTTATQTSPTTIPTAMPTTRAGEPTRIPTAVPTNVPPTVIPTRAPVPTATPQQPPTTTGGAVNVTIDYLACLQLHPGNSAACQAPVLSTQSAPVPTPVPTAVPTLVPTAAPAAPGNSGPHRNDTNNRNQNSIR